jgi:hypothetical protein
MFYTNILNNNLSIILTILLTLYTGLVAPELPKDLSDIFENDIFKLFIMLMVLYTSTKNTTIALLLTIGFVISIQSLTKQKINTKLINLLENRTTKSNNKKVTFNENHNEIYHLDLDNNIDTDIIDYDSENLHKYVGGVANQINEMSNDSEYSMDDENGLGWDCYYDEPNNYTSF